MSGVLRILTWWARDYAYAAWWQARALINRTDPATFTTGAGTTFVVLPGVYETWKFLQPLVTALHRRGHPVHVITALQYNRRPVVEAAGVVSDYLEQHELRDVVLLAHSKGGLIGKQVMALTEAAPRVRAMLAVATPFGGSRYGQLLPIAALRAFSPRDATILALGRESAVNARIVSVYPRFDPHIPESSELDGATNVRLETGGHFRVLAQPRVLAEAVRLAE